MLAIILLLVATGVFIQVQKVQTFLAQKAASYLSEKLKVPIRIEGVDIEFFSKVVLEEVYVEDLHQDTVLFAQEIKLNIGEIKLDSQLLVVHTVELVNATSKIIRYKSDGEYNYQFIVDAFASSDTSSTPNTKPWNVKFNNIILDNINFTYKDEKNYFPVSYGMNYFDLGASDIHANISEIHFNKDTIFGNINHLSVKEKCGFILEKFSGIAQVSSTGIHVDDLHIKTPSSTIATDLQFTYKQYTDFYDFNNKVIMKASFNKTVVDMADIAYYASELKGLNKKVMLSGNIKGKVSDLSGKKMNLSIVNSNTRFKGDIKLTGLPNIEETFIYLNIEQLNTNYKDLVQIPTYPFDANKLLSLPPNLASLGNTKFKGTFTGLYNDFYAYGNLTSSLGSLSLDLSMGYDQIKKTEKYQGRLKSYEFDFGVFLGTSVLGKTTANVVIDGVGLSLETVNAKLDGTISSLNFKDYNYKNISIRADVAKQIFRGELNVQDDNIDFYFDGNVDYSKAIPEFDFTASINKARLYELHFIESNRKTDLSAQIKVNMQGDNIDDLMGDISLTGIKYFQDNVMYSSERIDITSEVYNDSKTLELVSDFAEVKIDGDFKVLELPAALEKEMSKYLPAYFNNSEVYKRVSPQNFDYEIEFKNTSSVTHLFIPSLTIAPSSKIFGSFNSESNQFLLNADSPKLTWNKMVFKNWNTSINGRESLVFENSFERIYLSDSIWVDGFKISGNAINDSMNTNIVWNNNTPKQNNGNISTIFLVDKSNRINLNVLPSQFAINDSVWDISTKDFIVIDSSLINIKELIIKHNNQSLVVNGIVSKKKTDELSVILNNFHLENFNFYTSSLGFTFNGIVNGKSTMSNLFENPLFISETAFHSLYINDNKLGEGELQSLWENNKEVLYLKGSFILDYTPNITFSGYYYPKLSKNNIEMDLSLDAINMNMFKPVVKDVCSEFKGFISGKAHISGMHNRPVFSGFLNVDAENVTIDYLKTAYRFSHRIEIDSNSFDINNMILYDENTNTANVQGKLKHNNFSDFQLDFTIDANKFMGLNTTEKDNDLFYGKAYVSGIIGISGTIDNILIDANVKTESVTLNDKVDKLNLLSKTEYTKFYIPLNSQSDLGENDFVTFVKTDSALNIKNNSNKYLKGITMNFQLQATPDAEVQLIFDQRVGDIIKARGNGNIKMNIDTKGDFKMYGSYVIENGDYLFTLKNIINKKFDIVKGSTIKWTGIPYNADLNVTAKYRTKALLNPIIDSLTRKTYNLDSRKHYAVDLKLFMTGDLMAPEIKFGVDLPTVNSSVNQYVSNYLSNETEMNRQVVPLLLASTFVSPSQSNNSNVSGSGSVGANTVEILSNQLNNMLSGLSKDYVNVGINYSPGTVASREELDLALSTQLFNNKVTIDGNLGVNNNTAATTAKNNSNNIVGDVNIDYKLTDDGKLRVKAFNKTNDNIQVSTNGLYTQGVGVFYREEFDAITDLYRRYKKFFQRKKKKTNQPDGIIPE
jgi:hypothetical protein